MPDKAQQPWFPDRCDIQQDSSADGNPIEDFSGAVFKENVPCRFIQTGGDETYRGRQLEPHIDGVIEMRYFSGVLPTMRIKMTTGIHQNRYFNIEHVNPMRQPGSPPLLALKCSEKVVV